MLPARIVTLDRLSFILSNLNKNNVKDVKIKGCSSMYDFDIYVGVSVYKVKGVAYSTVKSAVDSSVKESLE